MRAVVSFRGERPNRISRDRTRWTAGEESLMKHRVFAARRDIGGCKLPPAYIALCHSYNICVSRSTIRAEFTSSQKNIDVT